jgi:DNA-binding transcriptional MerR regulator
MNDDNESPLLRIGELSRRVGVSEHVLRAWETRYGLLRPVRSSGGYRLYSHQDESRVRRMQLHLAAGLAAAQAAQAVVAQDRELIEVGLAEGQGFAGRPSEDQRDVSAEGGGLTLWGDLTPNLSSVSGLRRALDDLDEPAAERVLDRLLRDHDVEILLRDVLMPYLHELGERWAKGAVTVVQEHFASHVIRGWMTRLTRGWGSGYGPHVLLACPPGELHDLALLGFGIVLDRKGWRVGYLGADTPMPALIQTASEMRPSLVVLAASTPERFAAVIPEISVLAVVCRVAIAGAGATQQLAHQADAWFLASDPVTEADHLAELLR